MILGASFDLLYRFLDGNNVTKSYSVYMKYYSKQGEKIENRDSTSTNSKNTNVELRIRGGSPHQIDS
jgi:hypothetical protein